jgi:hypothetical protein
MNDQSSNSKAKHVFGDILILILTLASIFSLGATLMCGMGGSSKECALAARAIHFLPLQLYFLVSVFTDIFKRHLSKRFKIIGLMIVIIIASFPHFIFYLAETDYYIDKQTKLFLTEYKNEEETLLNSQDRETCYLLSIGVLEYGVKIQEDNSLIKMPGTFVTFAVSDVNGMLYQYVAETDKFDKDFSIFVKDNLRPGTFYSEPQKNFYYSLNESKAKVMGKCSFEKAKVQSVHKSTSVNVDYNLLLSHSTAIIHSILTSDGKEIDFKDYINGDFIKHANAIIEKNIDNYIFNRYAN